MKSLISKFILRRRFLYKSAIWCALMFTFVGVIAAQDFSSSNLENDFRLETMPVEGGAEIITVFVKMRGAESFGAEKNEFVPMLSVLRDTLGDDVKENDLIRQVWLHTYTRPSILQRVAAGVPLLYHRTTNKNPLERNAPAPPIADLHPSKKDIWNRVFWFALRNWIVNDLAFPARVPVLQYQNNARNYRRSAIARSLALLKLFEKIEGEQILSDREIRDVQSRLMLSEKVFGSLMKKENLDRVYDSRSAETTLRRGANWELLRQYSEKQGLYFEPLTMPDGSSTHAILWTSAEDLTKNRGKSFDSRFLNIKNPWKDSRLIIPSVANKFNHFRWFDENNRETEPNAPNAVRRTMIPLAVYGLDNPKIPTILIDFRDTENPKIREMSKRMLNDITRNIFSISRFQSLPYFFGRFLYDFVTIRRGIDFNQQTRLRSYSQLKLLLALNDSLEPEFRKDIARRLENVSLNPLENNIEVEIRLARRQFENLQRAAADKNGLPAMVAEQRREEMTRLKHTAKQRFLYNLGKTVSFGIYRHREKYTPELFAEMDLRRRLDFHERIIRETARVTAQPEIDADLPQLYKSLEFIARYGQTARPLTARAIEKILQNSHDEGLQTHCLTALKGIENTTAKQILTKNQMSAPGSE